jgi:hypothetical protein
MLIPSYYGDLAASQNLQFILDQSQDVLGQASIWRQWLTQGIPQASLTYTDVIGRDRISAAASIVDADSPAPLRSRNKVERYSGTIPSIKEKFRMTQSDMRAIEVLKSLPIGDINQQLIQFLTADLREAAVAGDKRVDIMMLQILSTLTVDATLGNNPDGAAQSAALSVLPYYGSATQIQGVPVVWGTTASSTPFDDIDKFLTINRNTRGRTFGKILMSAANWVNFKNSVQVKAYLAGFYNTGKANNATSFGVTTANVNEYMSANNYPPIYIINYTANIETDGVPTFIRPFADNNVVFVPDGKLGVLANATPIEKYRPIPDKQYADYGPTLVSKWWSNDPIAEYTGMEMNAFPVMAVDSIFILNTNSVQASFT